ncbi:MAG: MATE family efflux transporter [Anaerofustis sp.]
MNQKMRSLDKRDFILTGKLSTVILSISAPLMLNNLIQTIYNLTDTMFITLIDPLAVGAVSFLFPIIYNNMDVAISFSVAAMSLIAQYTGAGRGDKAKLCASQLVILSLILSGGLILINYLFGPGLAVLLGLSGEMYQYGIDYFMVIIWEIPFIFIMNCYNAVRQGQGDTFTPMVYTVISVILNIIFDPIFMFVFGMGIRGAAVATILARLCVCVPELITLSNTESGIRLRFHDIRFHKPMMKQLLSVGLPAVIGETVSNMGFLVLNYFIIGFGDATMTAFAIGNRILNVVTLPIMGIGSGLAVIIGQNLGAKKIKRAKQAVNISMLIGCGIMVLGGLLMVATADRTVGFFAGKEGLIFDQAKTYLIYLGYSNVFMAAFMVFMGVFQGSGQSRTMMLMSMIRLWVIRLPILWLLGRYTSLNEVSVWISMSFSNAIVDAICWIIYRKGKWEKGRIEEISAIANE